MDKEVMISVLDKLENARRVEQHRQHPDRVVYDVTFTENERAELLRTLDIIRYGKP